MKNRTHIPVDPYEKQSFKKKFLERKMQDDDAQKQIRDYRHETEASAEVPEAPSVATKREL